MNTQASSSKYIEEDCIYSNKFIGDNENQRLRSRSIELVCEKRVLLVTACKDQDSERRTTKFKHIEQAGICKYTNVIVNYLLNHTVRGIRPCMNKQSCRICAANNTRDSQLFTLSHCTRSTTLCKQSGTICVANNTRDSQLFLSHCTRFTNLCQQSCNVCAANNTRDSQLFNYYTVQGIQRCVNKATQSVLPTTHVIVNSFLNPTERGIQPCVNKVTQSVLPTTHVIVNYLRITL